MRLRFFLASFFSFARSDDVIDLDANNFDDRVSEVNSFKFFTFLQFLFDFL